MKLNEATYLGDIGDVSSIKRIMRYRKVEISVSDPINKVIREPYLNKLEKELVEYCGQKDANKSVISYVFTFIKALKDKLFDNDESFAVVTSIKQENGDIILHLSNSKQLKFDHKSDPRYYYLSI